MRLVIVILTAVWVLQAAQGVMPSSSPEITWINQAEHLTLSGAMVVALIVLWKSHQAKDFAVLESTRAMTSAMSASAASNAELRAIISESVEAKRQLGESIDMLRMELSRLPCVLPQVR